MQYIVFIHTNTTSVPSAQDWADFFIRAQASGLFQGGSEIGLREQLGDLVVPDTTASVGGFMQFESDDKAALLELLALHPVRLHGGTLELCEMPRS